MWSPRELAELAGTSRRAVRHYDEIGLLPQPHRQSNGYGRYGVDHLVRLLRIRRLVALGLTLPQIAALGDADHPPAELIRALDAEMAHRMDDLARTRQELAAMLEHPGPVEIPTTVADGMERLPGAERALVVVLSRLLDPAALESYVGVLPPYRDHPSVAEFDALPETGGAVDHAGLARRLAAHFADFRSRHTRELDEVNHSTYHWVRSKRQTLDEAERELYNPSQRDVLRRVLALQPVAVAAQQSGSAARVTVSLSGPFADPGER